MTLSDLRTKLESLRASADPNDGPLLDLFINRIGAWRGDGTTPRQLMDGLDRTLGNVWFADEETHRSAYRLLQEFRTTVDSLGGMTMNERLVMFDLMDEWDRASEEQRRALYAKLEATP